MVSVILSVFNAENKVAPAIESILNQSYNDIELLIIDDNSVDNSAEIIKKYLKDARVKFYKNESNKGLPHNLNRLIMLSKGDFIARMDADDISHEERLFEQMKYLQDNPDVDMVGTFTYLIDEQDNTIGERKVALTTNFKTLLKRIDVTHPSVMFRGDFFKKYGFYDESLKNAQDMDLWLKATKKGAIIHNIPKFLYYLRYDNDVIRRRKRGQLYRIKIKKKHLTGFKFLWEIIPNLLVIITPSLILRYILQSKYKLNCSSTSQAISVLSEQTSKTFTNPLD